MIVGLSTKMRVNKRHLGIDVQVWGGAAFDWTDADGKPVAGTTAWLVDPQENDHYSI